MKKLLSVLLAFVLAVSGTASVCAISENTESGENIETNATCDYFGRVDALVITFDSNYTKINKLPKVDLDTHEPLDTTNIKISVPDDHIIMKIYEHDGKRFPQVFIDTDICGIITNVRIEAGAFSDDNGNTSKEAVFSHSQIKVKSETENFGLACETKGYYTKDKKNSNTKEWFVTANTPVNITAHLDSDYMDAWKANSTLNCSINGIVSDITEGEMIPMEVGEYVIEFKLNDIFCSVRRFNVVSDATAYFHRLGETFLHLIASPVELLFGVFVFFFLPGVGTMGGLVFMQDAVMSIPVFFEALFKGPELSDLNF